MLRQYDLLENVLIDIENAVREGINSDILAEKYTLSERHLRKLFKFAFKQPLGGYIRSRRLAASLDDLLKTNFNILDIALEYGFEYEQSYRRAFKHEFGITPGEYRKAGHIVNSFDIPEGEYLIALFQDTNNNGQLDTNFLGFPREPVGLSNYSGGIPGGNKKKKIPINSNSNRVTINIGKV
jgi:AraC-like DNA-binding protein